MFDIIVIGGANIDIKARAGGKYIAGTSNPGSVSFTPGGVARNIAHNLGSLGVNVALISAFGKDAAGEIAIAATKAAGVDLSLCLRGPLQPAPMWRCWMRRANSSPPSTTWAFWKA